MDNTQRYNPLTIWLHWLSAFLIIGVFAGGLLLEAVPREYFGTLIGLHKLGGVTILVLVAIRLMYRLAYRSPTYPIQFSMGYRLLIKAGHLALYILMTLTPILGWYVSNAHGYPVSFFGLFPLPMLTEKLPKEITHIWVERHELAAFGLIALALGHMLLAVYHHWVKKDLSIRRMLPF